MRAICSAAFCAADPISAGLAQLVEQRFCKPKVAGSIPAAGTIAMRRLVVLLFMLVIAGCAVGVRVSNTPESIESCGRKIGGC